MKLRETAFDASKYLTKLKGKDYLEVKWRLLWLRTDHPEALIATELVRLEEGLAVFKAKVTIPGAGEATGWGSETTQDFEDYIEKAETKSLGRALAALGYGTQFCEDFDFGRDDDYRVVDAPVDRNRLYERSPRQSSERASLPVTSSAATPAQVKAIYLIGRSEHQLSDDELDERCRQAYGHPPGELTKKQASEFIDRLKASGVR
ncbi:MAG: hypothetical protein Q7O66_02955 [Dehalococcoidia bacterium]|nr:hypothetical protein [Dehalococcoidia bacterium]